MYTKDIYIIMSDDMEKNIKNKNNNQFFLDTTYYDTPPNSNKIKL